MMSKTCFRYVVHAWGAQSGPKSLEFFTLTRTHARVRVKKFKEMGARKRPV